MGFFSSSSNRDRRKQSNAHPSPPSPSPPLRARRSSFTDPPRLPERPLHRHHPSAPQAHQPYPQKPYAQPPYSQQPYAQQSHVYPHPQNMVRPTTAAGFSYSPAPQPAWTPVPVPVPAPQHPQLQPQQNPRLPTVVVNQHHYHNHAIAHQQPHAYYQAQQHPPSQTQQAHVLAQQPYHHQHAYQHPQQHQQQPQQHQQLVHRQSQPQTHCHPYKHQPAQPAQNQQSQQHQNQHQQPPSSSIGRWSSSMVNLGAINLKDSSLSALQSRSGQLLTSTSAWSSMYDDICQRFDNVMTLIDQENMPTNHMDLFAYHSDAKPALPERPLQTQHQQSEAAGSMDLTLVRPEEAEPEHGTVTDRSLGSQWLSKKPSREGPVNNVAEEVASGKYFSKVESYANSRLPANLPPLALYMATWPLLCLAAQYSLQVYDSPKGAERHTHVSARWRTGTKAMCVKSVPMDHVGTIVFAIRGTASFMDWAVNLNSAPASPSGFLDDPGNLCHAGFLSVARKTIRPLAARLRQLLEEDPGRAGYNLLITGHSAGGAVAALLYSHMMAVSREAESELSILAGYVKRIHCVTFGAPPVSLLPLEKPNNPELRKSLFLSFVNEGDPVVRADKSYVKSLLELLASPAPPSTMPHPQSKQKSSDACTKTLRKSKSRLFFPSSSSKLAVDSQCPDLPPRPSSSTGNGTRISSKPAWKVPPCTLSNSGRIIILRSTELNARPSDRKTVGERLAEGVAAVTCREDQLRDVIWGDPVCHMMSLYAGRLEALAVEAVTAATIKGR